MNARRVRNVRQGVLQVQNRCGVEFVVVLVPFAAAYLVSYPLWFRTLPDNQGVMLTGAFRGLASQTIHPGQQPGRNFRPGFFMRNGVAHAGVNFGIHPKSTGCRAYQEGGNQGILFGAHD